MPAQDSGRVTGKTSRPPMAAHQPGQCRNPHPVGMIHRRARPRNWRRSAWFSWCSISSSASLDKVRPGQHRQQAKQAPGQPVDERQQHPRWSQPHYRPLHLNPSSPQRHKPEFPARNISGFTTIWDGPPESEAAFRAAMRMQHSRGNVCPLLLPRSAATHGHCPSAPRPGRVRRALRGNENVGGDRHDCDMSELHITGAAPIRSGSRPRYPWSTSTPQFTCGE